MRINPKIIVPLTILTVAIQRSFLFSYIKKTNFFCKLEVGVLRLNGTYLKFYYVIYFDFDVCHRWRKTTITFFP